MGRTATAPLQRLTVIAQTATLFKPAVGGHIGARRLVDKAILDGAKYIVRSEGLVALWKGNACTCLQRFPFAGVNFAVFEYCKRLCGNGRSSAWLSGAAGGCAAVVACYPLEIVRIRLMTQFGKGDQRYAGSLDCAKKIFRKEGLGGLYRGIGVSLTLTIPAISIAFGVYSTSKELLEDLGYSDQSAIATICAGGIGGVAGSFATFPLDVLRRRIQVMGACPTIPRRKLMQEARHVFTTEGVRGFWRGLKPEMIRAFPLVGITFLVYESLNPVPLCTAQKTLSGMVEMSH